MTQFLFLRAPAAVGLRLAALAGLLLSAYTAGTPAEAQDHIGDKPRTRIVTEHGLSSDHLPDARIVLPEAAEFVGSMRFDLYDVADAEIYLFAETDADDAIERLYWIQFEAYLPSAPEAAYDPGHRGEPLTALGEMDLFYRARFGSREDEMPDGSEAARVVQMVRDAGYTMPAETFSAQFHQTVHPDNRSEILVIYVEDLAAIDLTVEEIFAGGREGEPMRRLHDRALPRAQARIRVER